MCDRQTDRQILQKQSISTGEIYSAVYGLT